MGDPRGTVDHLDNAVSSSRADWRLRRSLLSQSCFWKIGFWFGRLVRLSPVEGRRQIGRQRIRPIEIDVERSTELDSGQETTGQTEQPVENTKVFATSRAEGCNKAFFETLTFNIKG